MDCAEACPLPDQEGCHPMKHCQPPWRRQSEPEISSEFRVQLRSEDPGRFSGAGSAAFSGWRPAMRKACCPQRAGKAGRRKLLWRTDVCDGAAVAQSAAGGSFSVFTVLAALCVGSGVQAHSLTAVISRRLPVSVHWIGIVAALLAGSILIGGAKKTAKVCTCLVPVMSVLYLGSCLFLLVKNAAWIPAALRAIFVSAFRKSGDRRHCRDCSENGGSHRNGEGTFYKRGWNGLDADDSGSGGRAIYTGSGAGFDDGSVLGYAGDVRGDGACNFERYGKKCRSLQGGCCR